MVKFVQTKLAKVWQKRSTSVQPGFRNKELPKVIVRLIKSFATRQKTIPELMWKEFERQCRKTYKCAGCNEMMPSNRMLVCWDCFKYTTKNGTGPLKYAYDLQDEINERFPNVPHMSFVAMCEFEWFFKRTGCRTGYLY